MTDKKLIGILADAVETGLKFLPNSHHYEKKDGISWVWEECTDEEQEEVKGARGKMNIAYRTYLERKEQAK